MARDRRWRVELTRVYHFSAAHCLASPALSADENAALYGPCARPHGHNYYLEVTVSGVPDRVTGFAADLAGGGARGEQPRRTDRQQARCQRNEGLQSDPRRTFTATSTLTLTGPSVPCS